MIKRNEYILLRDIHSAYFLINIKEKYYEHNKALVGINELGKYIWEFIKEPKTIDEIVDFIVEKYSISIEDKPIVFNDVSAFIEQLLNLGYVVDE